MFISLALTPLVKILAVKIGAVDKPNERRINTKIMPSMGGLAIYLAFSFSSFFIFSDVIPRSYVLPIIFSAGIVVITGMLDDIKEISPKKKMIGLMCAALSIYFIAGIKIDTLSIPFIGSWNLGWFSLPITLLWILAITNAINLIDGLDGLASGVSMIGLSTIGIIGYFYLHASTIFIPILIFVLVASIAGFFPYNFQPASIFLGDTGALFLGFMISVLSLQGLKNATLITLITPLIILGVPITDTVFAMIRRVLNNKPISSADKMHLHHRLLSLGFTHRGAVLTIYCLAIIFSFIALVYNYTSMWGSVILTLAILLGIDLFVELIGLAGEKYQPILYLLKLVGNKEYRENRKTKQKNKS